MFRSQTESLRFEANPFTLEHIRPSGEADGSRLLNRFEYDILYQETTKPATQERKAMILIPRLAASARRFHRAKSELRLRSEFEALSRASIQAFQLARLNELWTIASRSVPHYRELRLKLRLPDRFRSLDEFGDRMPVLEKSLVRNDSARFLSENRESGFWKRTGGSTGIPIRCFRSYRAHLENLWDRDYVLETWGLRVWDPFAFIDGHRHDLESSWSGRLAKRKQAAEGRVRRRLRLSAYYLDEDRLRSYHARMRRAGVKCLYSYSTAAFLLAKAAAVEPPIKTLKLVVTYAEPLPDHQREAIERVFRVPVATEYSAIELGYLAGTHGDNRVRIAEHGVIFETEPTPAGRFEIILTDLRNPDFPLLRYRLEDVLAAPPEYGRTGCGVIGPVEGRTLDVLRTRSGKVFHGTAVIVIVKEYPFVKLFQAVQDNWDEVTVNIQSDIDGVEAKVREMAERLETGFEGELRVRIKPVPRIEATAAGKRRLIISRIG